MTVSIELLLKDSQFQSAAKNVQNAMIRSSMATAKFDNALSLVNAKATATAAILAQKHANALSLTEAKTKAAGEASGKAGGEIKKMIDPLEVAREGLRKMSEGAHEMANAIGAGEASGVVKGFATSLAGMAQLLDLIVPGLGQAASAIISFMGGIAGATVGLIQKSAELALEQTALKEKMIVGFTAMAGGSEEAGKSIFAMVDGLSEKLPQSREQIGQWAQKFTAAGVSADKLATQLTAMASASSMGAEVASGFQTLTDKILASQAAHSKLVVSAKQFKQLNALGIAPDVAKKLGLNVQQLAAQLKAGSIDATKFGDAMNSSMIEKGAGPLAAMGGELSTQWGKFKENIGKLFDGIDVAPFLAAMKDMFSVFSQSSASGKAMKSQITGAMNSIFAVLTKLVPYVKLFFLYIVKYALEAKIFLVPLVAKIKEFWQQHDGMTKLMFVLKGVGVVLGVIAAIVVVAVGEFLAFQAVCVAVSVAVWGVIGALVSLVVAGVQIFNNWVASAIDVGSRFIDGLVNGISQGAARVKQAAIDVAMAAKNAVTDALGIHSPSRVMMTLGGHMATGLAQGLSGGGGEVAAAAGGVSGGAVSAMASGGGAPPAPSGGGMTINVGGITIGGGGGEGASKTALELTEEAVIQLFERVALAQGVGT